LQKVDGFVADDPNRGTVNNLMKVSPSRRTLGMSFQAGERVSPPKGFPVTPTPSRCWANRQDQVNAMKCELLETTKNGQELAVTFTLEDGKVTAKAESASEGIVGDLENQTIFAGGRSIKLKDDPTAWFMGLPEFYNGSALRAHMVPDDHKMKTHPKKPHVDSSANTDDKPVKPTQEPKVKVVRGITITDTTEPGRAFIMPWHGPIPKDPTKN
jgi:hypothetical protein